MYIYSTLTFNFTLFLFKKNFSHMSINWMPKKSFMLLGSHCNVCESYQCSFHLCAQPSDCMRSREGKILFSTHRIQTMQM